MKKTIIQFIILLLVISSFVNCTEKKTSKKRKSPKSEASVKIGETNIDISYSRPSVKKRKIWGDLVPYNEVWRTGADEATTISFSKDVVINNKNIPIGKYSFFTIPKMSEWIIILNKIHDQWGAFKYDKVKDLVRFKVKPVNSDHTEQLLYSFSDKTSNSVNLNIEWEKLKINFKINTK